MQDIIHKPIVCVIIIYYWEVLSSLKPRGAMVVCNALHLWRLQLYSHFVSHLNYILLLLLLYVICYVIG